MENITQIQKLSRMIEVYNLLQDMESNLSLIGFTSAKQELDDFLSDDGNLLKFFYYFSNHNAGRSYLPAKVGIRMIEFITPSAVARFIQAVPTCTFVNTDNYIDGPCSLATMMGSMFRHHKGHSWYTFDKTSEEMKKSLNYIKVKYPRQTLDLGDK